MAAYQFGLIGYPIKHSLSPWIHQQFFEATGINGNYSMIEIQPNKNFSESMKALKTMQLDGFNVTVPYKQKVMDYLDEVDEAALKIGAVNTVLCKNNRLIGYNTDGIGYVRSLEQKFPKLSENIDLPILILGAGGAAKGIYHGLKYAGYNHITIANRTTEKAAQIAGENCVISMNEAQERLAEFRLIIQTTSVGMKPNDHQSIISLENMTAETIASDIVYQPIMTKFLREAQTKTTSIHLGHTMLLYQAQSAFKIWTGQNPNTTGMDEALQKQLEG